MEIIPSLYSALSPSTGATNTSPSSLMNASNGGSLASLLAGDTYGSGSSSTSGNMTPQELEKMVLNMLVSLIDQMLHAKGSAQGSQGAQGSQQPQSSGSSPTTNAPSAAASDASDDGSDDGSDGDDSDDASGTPQNANYQGTSSAAPSQNSTSGANTSSATSSAGSSTSSGSSSSQSNGAGPSSGDRSGCSDSTGASDSSEIDNATAQSRYDAALQAAPTAADNPLKTMKNGNELYAAAKAYGLDPLMVGKMACGESNDTVGLKSSDGGLGLLQSTDHARVNFNASEAGKEALWGCQELRANFDSATHKGLSGTAADQWACDLYNTGTPGDPGVSNGYSSYYQWIMSCNINDPGNHA